MKREGPPGSKKPEQAKKRISSNDNNEHVKIKVLGIVVEARKISNRLIILVVIILLLAIALVWIAGTPLHYVLKGTLK